MIARLATALAALAASALAAPAAPAPASAEFGVQLRFETIAPPGAHPDLLPSDIAADEAGNVYVLYGEHVQKYDPSGALVAAWRSPAPSTAIAVDGAGHVFLAYGWGGQVFKTTTSGEPVATWGGFRNPAQLDVDGSGNVYVQEDPVYRPHERPAPTWLHKLSPAGEVLVRLQSPPDRIAVGSDGRLFRQASQGGIAWLDPGDLVPGGPDRTGGLRLAPGKKPGGRSPYEGTCCGIAALDGQVWVARGFLGLIEAYEPAGGLVRACPAARHIWSITGGRDGRLYVLEDRSIVRYGETASPCDTQAPRVTSLWMPRRVIDQSKRGRLRRSGVFLSTSEQGTATIAFTRLMEGRRVVEARFGGIVAYVTDPSGPRLAKLLRRKRLPVGRYEISVVITDRAGLRSKPARIRARVIR